MDIVAIQAALRIPEQRRSPESLREALDVFEHALRREAAATTEAALARRPSTLRARLKATTAADQARATLLTELRSLGAYYAADEPALR